MRLLENGGPRGRCMIGFPQLPGAQADDFDRSLVHAFPVIVLPGPIESCRAELTPLDRSEIEVGRECQLRCPDGQIRPARIVRREAYMLTVQAVYDVPVDVDEVGVWELLYAAGPKESDNAG